MSTPEPPNVPLSDPESDPAVRDSAAVLKKNQELLGQLKKIKDKHSALEAAASAVGIDVADPAGFVVKHEQAQRAKAQRETKVRDAVKDDLLERGVKLDKKLVSAIVTGATADESVTLDETGGPSGVTAYVDTWLAALKGGASKPSAPGLPDMSARPSPPPPGKPRSDGAASGASVEPTFADLTKQGPEAVAAFAQRDPARYAALREAHFQALKNPSRVTAPR